MKLLRVLHTFYGFIVFVTLFMIAFPFLMVPIIFPSRFKWIGFVNRWWARGLFFFIGVPVKVEYRKKLNIRQTYIFCPNHFSYLDIPTLGLNVCNAIFVGKNDMEGIPLFGYMYKKLHITVDRSKLKSRYTTLKRSMEAIDHGKSLVIFPEGGIMTEREPVLSRFKDGAFRIAIEKQIPIVPVSIPYNWILLPTDQFILHWHSLKVTFHEPIDTQGMTIDDLDTLKDKVYQVIEEDLQRHLLYENRPRPVG